VAGVKREDIVPGWTAPSGDVPRAARLLRRSPHKEPELPSGAQSL